MPDTKRADRLIAFSGGVLSDTVGPGDGAAYLENLVPPTSSNMGLAPREGIEWLYTLPDTTRTNNTCSVFLVTLDDITRQKMVVVQDPSTKQILHITKYTEQAGVTALPPFGCGHASLDDPGGEGCHLPVTPTPAPEFGNLLYFEHDAVDVVAGEVVTLTVKGVNQGGTTAWSTEDDTGKAGTDYTETGGNVTASDSSDGSISVQTAGAGLGKKFQVYLYDPAGDARLKNPSMCEVSIGEIPSLRFLSGPAFFMPAADNFHVLMMDEVTYDTNVVTLGMGTLNWDADAPHNTLIHFFDETPYYLLLNLYIDPATTTTTPGHWLVVYSLKDIKADPTATAAPLHVIQISDDFYRTYSNCPTAAGCDSTGLYYLLDTTSDTGFLSSVDLIEGTVTSISTDFVPATGFYKDATGPSGIRHAQFDSRGNLVVSAQANISAVSRQIVMVLGPDGVINLPDSGTYTYPGTGVNPMGHVAPSASGSVHLYNMDATSPSTDNNVVTYDFTDYTETAMSGYVMDISADGTRVVCFDWVSGGASAIAVRNFPGTTAHEQIEALSPGTIMNFISADNFMRTNGSDDPVKIYATADISLVETIDVATLLSDYYTSDQIDTTSNYAAFRARNIYGTFGGLS